MAVLIAFATVEGQTGKIARHVEAVAKEAGNNVQLLDASDLAARADWDAVDKVILAASVHERRHPKDFEVFVAAKHSELKERPVLLLSVSLSAAFEEGQDEAQDYADEMKMRTGLEPDAELMVAGAIRAQSYDYFSSQVLKHVVLRGRDFDPSVKEHEFTDWDEVSATVRDFLAEEGNSLKASA